MERDLTIHQPRGGTPGTDASPRHLTTRRGVDCHTPRLKLGGYATHRIGQVAFTMKRANWNIDWMNGWHTPISAGDLPLSLLVDVNGDLVVAKTSPASRSSSS